MEMSLVMEKGTIIITKIKYTGTIVGERGQNKLIIIIIKQVTIFLIIVMI